MKKTMLKSLEEVTAQVQINHKLLQATLRKLDSMSAGNQTEEFDIPVNEVFPLKTTKEVFINGPTAS